MIAPKCPAKSNYQYRSDVRPVWWNFSGYGGHGHGIDISGKYNYVFTFAELEDASVLSNHVLKGGLLMYSGKKLNDNRFACIYDLDFLVYKKVL
jgi:hypothetical protein